METRAGLKAGPYTGGEDNAAGAKEATVEAIKSGKVKKGDVITTARLAAILAVKDTPRLIPLCHPIPITGLELD